MFAASKTANVSGAVNYIEEVFSTYLYTGNGSTQTITNGIDLSTNGGLVWIKIRDTSVQDHALYDTARTARYKLSSNLTSAQVDTGTGTNKDFASFNSTGFSLGTPYYSDDVNGNSYPYVSWTFRKQPKFFDVVTYTGTGSNRTISHSLGSVPACIMVKRTDTTGAWQVYHRSLANTQYLVLNTTAAVATGATRWNSTTPTSSVFSLGTDATVNASGGTYVAYIFAHDAGGFGLTGTDNVISCGSYTGNGSAPGTVVTLGYEPQWVMIKASSGVGPWIMLNNMIGLSYTSSNTLQANANYIETAQSTFFNLTATGFELNTTDPEVNNSGSNYIYIAIRRGPMKVPTDATKVFKPTTAATDASAITTNFPVDLFTDWLTDSTYAKPWVDRLRGSTQWLTTTSTAIEASSFTANLASNVSYTPNFFGGSNIISYAFQRAPSFFDEVCFTGTGSNTTVSHNLAAVPEFIVVKKRNAAGTNWFVYSPTLGNTNYILLNSNNGSASGTNVWNSTTPTSSVFSVGTNDGVNGSANTYVAYLFATCAGVSKVGSYTGNGSTQTINCGFGAGGARFVLIKRTDTTGDWYAYDTARGMTALTDPYTLVNTTSAQVATLGSVTTVSTGFALNSSILAAINVNGGTYIYLSIA